MKGGSNTPWIRTEYALNNRSSNVNLRNFAGLFEAILGSFWGRFKIMDAHSHSQCTFNSVFFSTALIYSVMSFQFLQLLWSLDGAKRSIFPTSSHCAKKCSQPRDPRQSGGYIMRRYA
jgi:hypothetical protein